MGPGTPGSPRIPGTPFAPVVPGPPEIPWSPYNIKQIERERDGNKEIITEFNKLHVQCRYIYKNVTKIHVVLEQMLGVKKKRSLLDLRSVGIMSQ